MKQSERVLIIGGGVIGSCVAHALLKRGREVLVLDRTPERDIRSGCSYGNAGMVVPSHIIPLAAPGVMAKGLRWMLDAESPFSIRPRFSADLMLWLWKFARAATAKRVELAIPVLRDLSMESRRLFVAMAEEEGLDFGLQKRGLIMLCRTAEMLDEEAHLAGTAVAHGVEAQILDADAIRRLDPGIEMNVQGGVYFPKDCHLAPGKFMGELHRRIREMGGVIRHGAEVSSIRLEGRAARGVVLADGEEIDAGEVVLAGGSWSPVLLRGLETVLPMQAGKGYSVTLDSPPALPEICSILCEAKIAVTPMGDSLRFGGTMEIVGLDKSIAQRRMEGIRKAVPGYFPEFTADDLRTQPVWSGLRPCTPDGLPCIGRLRAYRHLTVATGHAMLGLSLGPVTGEMTAEIVCNEKLRIRSRLVEPDRFI